MAPSSLRQRMHEFMHVRNYSERTQKTYLGAAGSPLDHITPPRKR